MRVLFLALVILPSLSRAQPAPPPVASVEPPHRVPEQPQVCPQPAEPTAVDTRGAPRPGRESGRVDPGEPGDSTGRVVGRTVLFIPEGLLQLALLPVTAGYYVTSRYQLDDRYYRWFYSRDRTRSLTPTATFTTGFGVTVGARYLDTNTFGENEHGVLQATTGTSYRLGLFAGLDSGTRLGPVRLSASGNFDRRPEEPFYNIGNETDTIEHPGPMPNIDAFTDPTPVRAFFRYQESRAAANANVWLGSHFYIDALGSFTNLKYSHSNTFPSVDEVYDPATLVGFQEAQTRLYGELELRWDGRRPLSPWEPRTVYGTGSFASVFGGYSAAVIDDGTNFWHYGAELQQYLHLGFGPRVLILRLHGEAVSGNIDDIPMTELPMLGGSAFLRGYPYARFRDQIALTGTAQYMWPLAHYLSAFIFVDGGRVYPSWDGLTIDDMRGSYGLGLEMYKDDSFLLDIEMGIAMSGGMAFGLEFSPVLDERRRWR